MQKICWIKLMLFVVLFQKRILGQVVELKYRSVPAYPTKSIVSGILVSDSSISYRRFFAAKSITEANNRVTIDLLLSLYILSLIYHFYLLGISVNIFFIAEW